jgi:hypothetical protein
VGGPHDDATCLHVEANLLGVLALVQLDGPQGAVTSRVISIAFSPATHAAGWPL